LPSPTQGSSAQGSPDRFVCVVDSGWDWSISDSRVAAGIGILLSEEGRPLLHHNTDDAIGHGTAVADLVLQVAPGVKVVPVRVFHRRLETSPRVIARAIDWAIEFRAKIINLSLGTDSPDALHVLYGACQRAREEGCIVVAAGDRAAMSYPAIFDPVIGVRSIAHHRRFAVLYEAGAALEVGARGANQLARGLGGAVRSHDGSSFAAAIVSGCIARLVDQFGDLGLDDVRELLADPRILSQLALGAD
jgi:subtilisin family serine protease